MFFGLERLCSRFLPTLSQFTVSGAPLQRQLLPIHLTRPPNALYIYIYVIPAFCRDAQSCRLALRPLGF